MSTNARRVAASKAREFTHGHLFSADMLMAYFASADVRRLFTMLRYSSSFLFTWARHCLMRWPAHYSTPPPHAFRGHDKCTAAVVGVSNGFARLGEWRDGGSRFKGTVEYCSAYYFTKCCRHRPYAAARRRRSLVSVATLSLYTALIFRCARHMPSWARSRRARQKRR